MHAILTDRVVCEVEFSESAFREVLLVCLEDGDELHECVDTQPHGFEVEDMRVLFGVGLVETLLEHLCLF